MNKLSVIFVRLNKNRLNWVLGLAICIISAFNATFFSPKLFKFPSSDFENGYYIGALNLKNGQGYTNNEGKLITHWPPGNSLFITSFISSNKTESIKNLQIVNGFLTFFWALLLFKIFKKIIPQIPPFIILGLSVFWPPMLGIGYPGSTELLVSFILTLIVYVMLILIDNKSIILHLFLSVLIGLLFGYAVLVKTLVFPAFIFSIILLLVFWKNEKKWFRYLFTLIIIVSFFIVIFPWMTVYYNHTGQMGFTSAGIPSIKDGINQFPNLQSGTYLIGRFSLWYTFRDFLNDFINSLVKYPTSTLYLVFLKTVRAWYATASGRFEIIMIILNIPLLILFIVSVINTIKNYYRTPLIIFIVLFVVLGFWSTSIIVLSIFRYLSPVFPFILLIIFYGLFCFKIKSESQTKLHQ